LFYAYLKIIIINSKPNNHIIQRQKFVLQVSSESKAKPLHEMVSKYVNTQLKKTLDEVFSKFPQNSNLIKIDRLVLDLGEVSEQDFEKDVETALRKQFPVILTKLLENQEENIKQITTEKSRFKIVDFFLKNGYFPWWVPKDLTVNIDHLIKEILEQYPIRAKEFFEHHLRSRESRKRLQYQISKKSLRAISSIITEKKTLKWKDLRGKGRKNQQIKRDMKTTGEEGKDSALYINNAGLAVIAPFFIRYFDMLGMISDGKFKEKEMAKRAVHLMQYGATGLNETAEPFLTFNKILCGLPLSTPVPKSIELTEKEKKTTTEMMTAILGHWKGMGTTSIEGLRENFLMREGKLEWQKEGYWSLNVEKKSYDILMKSLPWSISIINYPWMDSRIQVEWI
jgi:hypothetical protein